MDSFVRKIEAEIVAKGLLPDSQAVLLAVSGGVDSMVMLQVMEQLAPLHGWKIVVAHFNHRLRGMDSHEDESFVKAASGRFGLKCLVDSADVQEWARQSGQSIEMAAREMRHRFLAETAREVKADRVALGHHANDQAELLLLRLFRGVIGEGLGGMKWENRSSVDPGIWLVRPFLGVSRVEMEAYAVRAGIEFRQDVSNADSRFLRNRIRHEVLPVLRQIEPEVELHLVRAAECFAEQSEALRGAVLSWKDLGVANFDSQPVALQRTFIHEQLIAAGIEPTFRLIENLRLTAGAHFATDPERVVSRNPSGTVKVESITRPKFCGDELPIQVSTPGAVLFSECTFSWKRVDAPQVVGVGNIETFDANRVGEAAVLRHWQPGDRFQPIGFDVPAKLQDLFTALKITAAEKRKRVVAVAADGTLFWVEGLRIGERFKLTKETRVGLRWEWGRVA